MILNVLSILGVMCCIRFLVTVFYLMFKDNWTELFQVVGLITMHIFTIWSIIHFFEWVS